MKSLKNISILISLILTGNIYSCKKDTVAPQEKYYSKIKSIIQINCYSCHSSSGAFTGRPTEFDTDQEITGQYQIIKAAVADPPTVGPGGNRRMPEGSSLSQADIDIIVKWFEKGGKATD